MSMAPSDPWLISSDWLITYMNLGTLYSINTETKEWCLEISRSSGASLLGREIPHPHCPRPLVLVLALLLPDLPLPHLHALPPRHRSAITLTCPAKSPQTPMMHRILNTAEPTMVPTPTSPLVMKTPETQSQHQPGCCGGCIQGVCRGTFLSVRLITEGMQEAVEDWRELSNLHWGHCPTRALALGLEHIHGK